MINISFRKNAEGIYNGFRSAGHAGYAESGQDIVCAAVSVLVINTINSIQSFASDVFELKTEEDKGVIEFKITSDEVSREAELLLNSLILGLQGILEDYGKKYIKLKL